MTEPIYEADRIHAGIIEAAPEVDQEWVDAAVAAWHEAPDPLPKDDEMRLILARVAPLIAEKAVNDERARLAAYLRSTVDTIDAKAEWLEGHGFGADPYYTGVVLELAAEIVRKAFTEENADA